MSDEKTRNSFCSYCGAKKNVKEMRAVTSNNALFQKWRASLGEEFYKNARYFSKPSICRSHFKSGSFGKISNSSIPLPLPFSNLVRELPLEYSTCELRKSSSQPSINTGGESCSNNFMEETMSEGEAENILQNVGKYLEEQDNTEDCGDNGDEDSSGMEADISLIEDQLDIVKDPNYQPSIVELIEKDESMIFEDGEKEAKSTTNFVYCFVLIESLLLLVEKCFDCHSSAKSTVKNVGSVIIIDCACECGKIWRFESSKKIMRTDGSKSRRYSLNVAVTAATVTIGQTYSNLLGFLNVLQAPCLSQATFFETRKNGIVPAIQKIYDDQSEKIGKILKSFGKKIDVSGDGMYDSRGFCAFWCRYVIMCAATKFILTFVNKRKTPGKSSKALESWAHKEALQQTIQKYSKLFGIQNPVKSMTTDRCPSITKTMAKSFPKLNHLYDLWHLVRNITMDVWPKRNQKQMMPIKPWLQHMLNNIYYAIQTSNGDGVLAKEQVMSTFAHIAGIHDDFQNIGWYTFTVLKKCAHEEKDVRNVGYLDLDDERDFKAWKLVKDIFLKGSRLEDLAKISPNFCTSEVESFNSLSAHYAPKDRYLHNHETSSKLAVLHWNHLKLEEFEGVRVVESMKTYTNKTKQEKRLKKVKTKSKHSWRNLILECSIVKLGNIREDLINSQDPDYEDNLNEDFAERLEFLMDELSDETDIEESSSESD